MMHPSTRADTATEHCGEIEDGGMAGWTTWHTQASP